MALARTTISIEQNTLDRFFKIHPTGMRSKAIQALMESALETNQDELSKAAELIETHPAFAEVRADSLLWESATALDGLVSK